MGGTSNEREVSLASGGNVADALESTGKYEVVRVDVKNDTLDDMPKDVARAYIALHGGWGENGGVQGALDRLGIPYTGPGVLASQIAMDKIKTKMVLEMKGVPTAAWGLANPDTEQSPLPLPVVVKPPADGSSVGISKVSDASQWSAARDAAFAAMKKTATQNTNSEQLTTNNSSPEAATEKADKVVLVEEFIPGREFTVGVIDGEPLPVIEIVAKGGWYGYEEKYNSDETKYPFFEDPVLAPKMQKLAVDAYNAVGCRGVTRVDFRMSPMGRMYVLELNTSPGFTSHSLVPKAGMKTGLTFAGVCEKILATARHD